MTSWPFSADEWNGVQDLALAVTNAGLASQALDRTIALQQLFGYLEDLELLHGAHPALLETRADFASDPTERYALYMQAIHMASKSELPTYSLRVSLAKVLAHDLLDYPSALNELDACKEEVLSIADTSELEEWQKLVLDYSKHK